MKKKDDQRDWKGAAEECLVIAINRAGELARDATEFKSLESLIKTVGDVVGAGLYLSRSQRGAAGSGSSDDGDD
jgi:hypothetical protein